MSKLLDCLRRNGPAGISVDDARQLFLWLYCTTSILPSALSGEPPDRGEVVSVFSSLAAEGVIGSGDLSERLGPHEWDRLVDDLLNQRVSLEDAFVERAKSYLAP